MTTDFGLKDPYVAEMKAVIISICPEAQIIDVTHNIEKFDVREGAYILSCIVPYFPANTIHIAVVDPGVGSKRRALVIQTKQGFLIGPDNGLLSLTAKQQEVKTIQELTNKQLMLPQVSSTFHGRDIFAATAAHLANGVLPNEFGNDVKDIMIPKFAKVFKDKEIITGEVLHIDDFGNIITNIVEKDVQNLRQTTLQIEFPHRKTQAFFSKTYDNVKPKKVVTFLGSQNYFEIAINKGNAAKQLKVRSGDKIKITSINKP
ncbi:MAG: SAM-dependent chlorinase/fluorinase [Crenarchaeota archaeon]|nr:SAM-dependent chlorinase/fluorinase [Thermoproteota archaeon]